MESKLKHDNRQDIELRPLPEVNIHNCQIEKELFLECRIAQRYYPCVTFEY